MTKEDLISAREKANNLFNRISSEYADMEGMEGYLVLSSLYGQCWLTDDPLTILIDFPAMIFDSEYKGKGIELLRSMQDIESQLRYASRGKMKKEIQEKIKKASLNLNANLNKMEFKEDTFIEIRFKRPILDLVFKLKKDPLVSQVHTPQSQASIRIVLGTLEELHQRQENNKTAGE
jgi:hypothetical protein